MKLFLSPRGLFVRAILIALAFGVVHALGFREHTRMLSGTPASPVLGAIYVIIYFAFVLGAPVLAIASVVLFFIEKVSPTKEA